MSTHRRIRVTLAAAAIVVSGALLASCSPTPTASPSPITSSTGAARTVAIPDTMLGGRVSWIFDVLNAPEDTTVEQWEPLLHESVTEVVSPADLVETLNTQIRPAQPFTATEYRETGQNQAVLTIEGTAGGPLDMTVAIDADNLITGFQFTPAAPDREPAASLDEVETRLAELAPNSRVLVEYDGDTLIESRADEPGALGSVFKLYVLAAVADAIEAGELSWDDTVTVTDEAKSLPSGQLQDQPAGTEVSVLRAAEMMISISDNTATDLLIDRVGRDRVEGTVREIGVADPDGLIPFGTTQEFFTLLWGADEEVVDRWTGGNTDQRREVLAELDAQPFSVTLDDVDEVPGWPEGVEWFASPRDIAAVHVALRERAERTPELLDVLGENPGIEVDAQRWPSVAFKGGSSPGVVSGSWSALDADGARLTVVILTSNEDAEVAATTTTPELFGLAQDIFALVE